ncbi:MAG: ATP-dependent helicase [Actinobacteria bacterium]|nr:ATP-dependent helicase [Actinomycetota bacterium]
MFGSQAIAAASSASVPDSSAWDEGLDEAQLSAVLHDGPPLIVVAGAGTGKTRTLTSRVARLLERGVDPSRILLLTFTRRAAEDMTARAAALSGGIRPSAGGRRVWGGTFHAVAHRLVSEFSEQLGVATISVIDPSDATDLLDMLRDDHALTGTSTRLPRAATMLDVYSRAVNTDRRVRDVVTTDFPWVDPHVEAVTALLRDYVDRKRQRGLFDFDDLLLAWRALLTEPAIRDVLTNRWDHVLVDEYQDVNRIQVDIVTQLRPGGVGLTVVGDDAQAVYGFRGATSSHLLELADALPQSRLVRLERNFRSRQRLLDLANVVRPGDPRQRLRLHADRAGAGARPRLVRCYDAAEEARTVVDAVLGAVQEGQPLRDQAVLMRAGHHSDLLELELSTRHVPFVKYGGLRFLEAAHVKDFLAALRVTLNQHDELAWFRVLRLHEGIGPARARALLPSVLSDDPDGGLTEVIAAAPARARTALDSTLHNYRHACFSDTASARVTACLAMLRPLLQARYPDAAARLVDLDRLAAAASSAADLVAYVADATLDPPRSTTDQAQPPHLDEDYLTLSTVHSAKGLEWESVHVIHAVDGAFPSDMALGTPDGLEEEQRLFYVALTRARESLSIYTPLRLPHHRRAHDDRHSYALASRFLTDEALATMDIHEVPRPVAPLGGLHAGLPKVARPTLDHLLL